MYPQHWPPWPHWKSYKGLCRPNAVLGLCRPRIAFWGQHHPAAEVHYPEKTFQSIISKNVISKPNRPIKTEAKILPLRPQIYHQPPKLETDLLAILQLPLLYPIENNNN